MSFFEKLISNICNCYTKDPGFFWGFLVFLVITGCGIYLTILVYRKIVGSEFYFKIIALLIFFFLGIILTLPIFLIEQALLFFGIEVKYQFLWVYIPIPILITILFKKIFKLHYGTNYLSKNNTSIQRQKDRKGNKRKKTKKEIAILIFFTIFAGTSIALAIDSVHSFLIPEIKDYIVLFIGLMVILGIILMVISKILEIIKFGNKLFLK